MLRAKLRDHSAQQTAERRIEPPYSPANPWQILYGIPLPQ